MAIGHGPVELPFKPHGKGGGSKKNKPYNIHPWFMIVLADAVILTYHGTIDKKLSESKDMPTKLFRQRMEQLLPGLFDWWDATKKDPTKTTSWRLLKNRIYKIYYNGTSARGRNHNPLTRKAISSEDWRPKIPLGHPLRDYHDAIRNGTLINLPNWKELFGVHRYREDNRLLYPQANQ